jgi:hypothetical protein
MSELPETIPGTETSADPRPRDSAQAEPAFSADRPEEPTPPLRHSDSSPADPSSPQQAFHEDGPRRTSRRSGGAAAAWLALLLILVLAGVATTPFWTPFVTPLLPWSRHAADREQALTARLDALAKDNAAAQAEIAGLQSAQNALSRRLGDSTAAPANLKAKIASLDQRLDALATQPAALAGFKAQLAKLSRRLDAVAAQPAALAGLKTEITALGRRLDAAAAQMAARPAADPAMVQKLRQDLRQDVAGLDRRTGNLADRVAALETRMVAKTRSADRRTALLLALLQMREGIENAQQPFAVPYNAFVTLAKGRPALVAAAQPLAPLAESGVASRTALVRDLSHLADRVAAARPAAPAGNWRERVLDQLRGLVTIRRLDSSGRTPPEAAVARARSDLARGDLAAAVAALKTLSGPAAALAQPWLAAARRRLKAEATLSRLQRMLAASGSSPTAAPASLTTPAPPVPQAGAQPAEHGPAAAAAGGRSRP